MKAVRDRERVTFLETRYPHFTNRPLIAALPLFILGLVVADSPWAFLLLIPAAALGRKYLLLGAALFAIGFLRHALTPAPLPPLETGDTTLSGTVVSTPVLAQEYQRYIIRTEGRNILVYEKPDRLVMSGDLVRVSGSLSTFSEQAPNTAYWKRRGITQLLTASWTGGTEVLAPGFGPSTWGGIWRDDMWGRLRRNLPMQEAAVAMGVVAGQQSLVPQDLVDNMQRAGTLHLLSTSGYNVMLLAAVLMVLLSHLPLQRGLQLGIAIIALLAYADAVGGRPPVIRATFMAGLYLGSFLFARSPDALSIWAAAAIGCLLVEPATLSDAGFHMSFATVLALILYLPGAMALTDKWTERYRTVAARWISKWGLATLATALIAGFASAPLTAYHFGQASVVSPIANLLTAPAIPLIYVGSASAQVTDVIATPVARGLDIALTGSFSGWIAAVNNTLGGLSWASVQVKPPLWLVSFLLLLIPALSRPRRRDPALQIGEP